MVPCLPQLLHDARFIGTSNTLVPSPNDSPSLGIVEDAAIDASFWHRRGVRVPHGHDVILRSVSLGRTLAFEAV